MAFSCVETDPVISACRKARSMFLDQNPYEHQTQNLYICSNLKCSAIGVHTTCLQKRNFLLRLRCSHRCMNQFRSGTIRHPSSLKGIDRLHTTNKNTHFMLVRLTSIATVKIDPKQGPTKLFPVKYNVPIDAIKPPTTRSSLRDTSTSQQERSFQLATKI